MKTVYSDWVVDPKLNFFCIQYRYKNQGLASESHFHNYIEITLVYEGEILYKLEGKEIYLKPGDIAIINHMQPHEVWVESKEAYITVLGFKPNLVWRGENDVDYGYVENFFNANEMFENKINKDDSYSEQIRTIISEIVYEDSRKEDGYKLMIKAKMLEFLTILYRHHPRLTNLNYYKYFNKFKEIIDYIYDNCGNELSLEDCAKLSGYSVTYFSTLFHKMFGYTFSNYLSKVRIEKSCEMLINTDKPISEVGQNCGLPNQSNFLELFKRFMHTTPLKYRKKNK